MRVSRFEPPGGLRIKIALHVFMFGKLHYLLTVSKVVTSS